MRIVGTSLEDFDDAGFRAFAEAAVEEFGGHHRISPEQWAEFASSLSYVPMGAGADALKAAVARAEEELGDGVRRLHYMSVPPKAAFDVIEMLREADLVDRSRVIMEKPFGTDLASAVVLNAAVLRNDARELSPDGIELTVATNLFAPHALLARISPQLAADARGPIAVTPIDGGRQRRFVHPGISQSRHFTRTAEPGIARHRKRLQSRDDGFRLQRVGEPGAGAVAGGASVLGVEEAAPVGAEERLLRGDPPADR